MNYISYSRLFIPYLLIVAGHLSAILLNWTEAIFYTKPLLMPLLMLAVWNSGVDSKFKKWLFGALAFGWLGDVLLLFAAKGTPFFLGGLGSFLAGHLVYLYLFAQLRKLDRAPWQWGVFLLALGILCGMLWLLWPGLGGLKIPVVVYGLVLSSMAVSAAHTLGGQSRMALGMGGFLFLLSDAMIAIEKFSSPFPGARLWIMSTYVFAQGALIYGVLSFLLQKEYRDH